MFDVSAVDVLTALVRFAFLVMFTLGYPGALSKHTFRHGDGKPIRPLASFFLAQVVLAALFLPGPIYTVGVFSLTATSLLLWRRWELPIKLSLVLCAYWPATVLFAPRILRVQEGRRRDRIVHEIMET